MRIFATAAILSGAALLAELPAEAATLNPGELVFMSSTTAAATPALAGTILRDESQAVLFDPTYLGDDLFTAARYDYRDRVIRSDANGAIIIAPKLDWVYNISIGTVFVDGFTLTGYAGYATDVVYRSDALGDRGPTMATRSADGDEISFSFGFPLISDNLLGGVYQSSLPVNILTDARRFTNTGRATFYGRSDERPGEILSWSIGGLAVPAPVPLPGTALLLLAGLAGLGSKPNQPIDFCISC